MPRRKGTKIPKKKKAKISIDLLNTFDFEDEYDLLVISFCLAYNDLLQVHKEMIFRSSAKYKRYRLYLLKIAISHLREAYCMIETNFERNQNVASRIKRIPGMLPLYEKIVDRVDGRGKDYFGKRVLFESRNLVNHYGFKEPKDKQLLLRIAKEMEAGAIPAEIVIGESQAETHFEFADTLLINALLTLGEDYGLNENEYFNKVSSLVVEVINLMVYVINDFLVSKAVI